MPHYLDRDIPQGSRLTCHTRHFSTDPHCERQAFLDHTEETFIRNGETPEEAAIRASLIYTRGQTDQSVCNASYSKGHIHLRWRDNVSDIEKTWSWDVSY